MRVKVIEMPLDFGASRHGADMGPSAIRLAGLQQRLESLGHEVTDYFSPIDIKPADYDDEGNPKAKYLNPIVRSCTQLALAVEESFREGDFPLIIGGDHSIALGSVAGVSAACIRQGKKLGILYVDAHGDFNTAETTLTGNIHGECMAASCGYGLPDLTDLYFKGQKVNPENVCFVGTRDLDAQEKNLMKKAGVTVFSMSDIDRQGFPVILQKIRNFFAEKVDCVHLSFDLDVLSNREGLMIMEEMCEMGKVCSAEIVELNPVLDIQNKTAVLAVDLIARILGDKIY